VLILSAALILALLLVEGKVYASEKLPALMESGLNVTSNFTFGGNIELPSEPSYVPQVHPLTEILIEATKSQTDNDQPFFTISGRIKNFQNQPIQGVSLTDGAEQNVFSDSNGDYEFTDLPTGIYTITPTYGQYVFSPTFRQVSVPPKANKQDFVQVMPSVYLPIITKKACQLLYFDDFSDPNSGWPNFEDENRQYEYVDGEYKILVKNAESWAGASPDFQASEYYVGVDVRSDSGVTGSHGIIFGLTEDWSGFYTFEIDPEGYYTVWKYSENGGWKNLIVEFSPFINKSTELNQLKVKRFGNSIEVYANGNLPEWDT
jgi:hypothetical protein